jgi:uncharacterized sporulation protein YeaH/YhbH (DUF444 family)
VVSIVDRRLNPKGKSHGNHQRFVRVARAELREAVARSLRKRNIGDLAKDSDDVEISTKRISEPRFRLAPNGGDKSYVLPGNKEFSEGDTLPRPAEGGGGAGGREGSPDGGGEDTFQFTLGRDEYLDILFEDLELPDLAKTELKHSTALAQRRAGYAPVGTPNNLALLRTMRNSLARRISLKRPDRREVEALARKIAELESEPERSVEDEDCLAKMRADFALLDRKLKVMPYLDPIDLRYNRFEPTPRPTSQAVMFCLMDVSGSMTEHMKDLAKRFFLLLHLFLTRRYEHVALVFIRHTSEAKEVDEETFFRRQETGGTVVSSALTEMQRIIAERFPVASWNIYAAQASDGDNYASDTELCLSLLRDAIMPQCQYFAYIEVREQNEDPVLSMGGGGATGLWRGYEALAGEFSNFAMKKVSEKGDIFPVFRELFAKKPGNPLPQRASR